MKRSFRVGFLIIAVSTVLMFSYRIGDADLGWHLRYGEAFLSTGHVMTDNQFSWDMADYRWANHSWGFDVFAALLFGGHRFWLLSLTAGIAIAAAIVLASPIVTTGSCLAILTYWYFGSELLNTGLRSQLFSLVLTAWLWRFLLKPKFHTGLYWLPLLFLIWANVHGQFIFGLATLAAAWLPKALGSDHRHRLQYVLLFIASAAATLVNPFGLSLWQTAIGHLNAPEFKYIYEWMPWELNTIRMMAFLGINAWFWYRWLKNRISTTVLLPLGITFAMAVLSRRMIPYYLIMALPLMAAELDRRLKVTHGVPLTLAVMVVIGSLHFYRQQPFSQSWDSYCQGNVHCSEASLRYMKDNRLTGKLFNAYRLGGYLIYRLPELKPMVDGRMTLWRNKDGYSSFLTYTRIIYTETGGRELFYQINPDYVLIQPQYPLSQMLINQEHWPIIYQDSQVYLFQNPRRAFPH